MEGLPYDFGIEEDPDDDIEKKPKTRASTAEKPKDPEARVELEPKTIDKEKLTEDLKDQVDTAPELDTEAPLDHLSRPETEAIAQTIAAERLVEIQTETPEISSERLAAESFLENVEASGDIDEAYNETLIELGETAIASRPLAEVETETALPVDPETLVEAAKIELSPDVSRRITKENEPLPRPKPTPESRPSRLPKKRPESSSRLQNGIVDYLVGRRFGRISAEHHESEIEQKLSYEVNQLRSDIASHETQVRQLAAKRVIEKKPERRRPKPAKAETIGKVLIDSELPQETESLVVGRRELAGISAHTMKRPELLKVAESIRLEGNSLRQIYESHLVGERGLRRIVAEYLRGGNFTRTLRRELLEREKDFERDPKLRDQASSQPMTSLHAELDDLLLRSGIDWSEPQPSLSQAQTKVKQANLPALIDGLRSQGKSARKLADIVMISLIIGLAAVIIVLILIR